MGIESYPHTVNEHSRAKEVLASVGESVMAIGAVCVVAVTGIPEAIRSLREPQSATLAKVIPIDRARTRR